MNSTRKRTIIVVTEAKAKGCETSGMTFKPGNAIREDKSTFKVLMKGGEGYASALEAAYQRTVK